MDPNLAGSKMPFTSGRHPDRRFFPFIFFSCRQNVVFSPETAERNASPLQKVAQAAVKRKKKIYLTFGWRPKGNPNLRRIIEERTGTR